MSVVETAKPIRVGDALVERGIVTHEQVDQALRIQQKDGRRKLLGEILIDQGHCTRQELIVALADAYGIPFVRLGRKFVDPRVKGALPREMVEARKALPLFKVDGVLTVAVTEPANVFLIEEIEQHAACAINLVAALDEDLRSTLDDIAPEEDAIGFEAMFAQVEASGAGPGDSDRTDVEELGSNSPVVQLVNHAIHSAIRERASDIHFEPDEGSFRIRTRIDGQLVEKLRPPPQMQAPIVARIKIMAGMDISERRLPQDGAIRVTSRGRPVDLRVSTLPNKFGEKVVIRVIDNSASLLTLDGLALSEPLRKSMEHMCAQPYGLILVTGPTGSGKSTTLYAMLNEINSPSINICTCEDPIEFNVPGVNQFQVREKIGLTFASMLRTMLRQDPDVIMVGEIRDPETARIAIQAALTGHLVLSTLHTNDSAGAITRLQNLQVEPYLISAALVGVIAQRLVRNVCSQCQTMSDPPPVVAENAARVGIQLDKVARGLGCAVCNQTGFKGRSGLYEVLDPDDEFRNSIATGANLGELRMLARKRGMKTLFEYGMQKVQSADTTAEEVMRVTAG